MFCAVWRGGEVCLFVLLCAYLAMNVWIGFVVGACFRGCMWKGMDGEKGEG